MGNSSYTLESSHELGSLDAGIETKEGQTIEFVFLLNIINNKSLFCFVLTELIVKTAHHFGR